MRTIKFRGKRIDNGEWVYGYLFRSTKSTVKEIELGYYIQVVNKDFTHISYEVIPETVGQYWHNINAKELYDGDVFESKFYEDVPKWVVQYREDEAQFCIIHPEELKLKYISFWRTPDKKWWRDFEHELEIIGNIHDNPDLIK